MDLKIKKFIEEHQLFTRSDKLLVGVSGGRDSMAMLHVLYRLGYDITVAHCNFNLRGEESQRDAVFVSEHVRGMDVPLFMIDFQADKYAKSNGLSIEMAARELRYDWFKSLMENVGAKYIVVAHHSDDVIETFLINMTRGTGLHGLTGIKPKNGNIVRPMLCVTRNEITDYVFDNQIEYVDDSTNFESVYVRNKMRNVIIPALETVNTSFRASTIQSIENLAHAQNFVQYYINDLRSRMITEEESMDVLDTQTLKTAPEPIYVLYEMLKPYSFSAACVKNIYECINNSDASGQQFYSATGVRAVKSRDKLILQKKTGANIGGEFEIQSDVRIIETPITLKLAYINREFFTIMKDPNICSVDAYKLTFPLKLRKWRQADVFYPFGMKGKKKVSDYFVDSKMSLIEKEETWILESGGEIVWIVGRRMDDRFKVTEKTTSVLTLVWEK